MKIHDLATEMQSFVNVPEETLELAKASKITDKNNKDFKDLVRGWTSGIYDEDPEILVNEIKYLLKKK